MRKSIFLDACGLKAVPRTPVWLMRQAGRYMKDYRRLRERTGFLTLCKDSDLAAEVTVHAQQRLNADAAIIFSDILLIIESFGLGLSYEKGEGPVIARPVRSAADVRALPKIDPRESLGFVFDAIKKTRRGLKNDIALIGFAGAPFTVASYMIEGGASKDFRRTKAFMRSQPAAWRLLMGRIADATTLYLHRQLKSGADALQLFDSWAGALTGAEYERYALPFSRQVLSSVSKKAPVIHFGTGTGPFLESFARAGGTVISVDHHIRLDRAWERIGYKRAIQGNLDPRVLFKKPPAIKKEVMKVLRQAGGRPGHIFNLGHGVLPNTPEENVIALVEMVHELG